MHYNAECIVWTRRPGPILEKGKPHMSLFSRKQNEEPTSSLDELGDEYYVYPVEDLPVHTPDHPFCDDLTCPCHEDQDAIAELNSFYQDGLVSRDDAERIYRGQTL